MKSTAPDITKDDPLYEDPEDGYSSDSSYEYVYVTATESDSDETEDEE